MPLHFEITFDPLEGKIDDLTVARNEVLATRVGLGNEVGNLLGMGLSNSAIRFPQRPKFIPESRLTREVLGHGNEKNNLLVTWEDPAVLFKLAIGAE
jgi:hypothetical protein